jgi:hypothetical protein
MALTDTTYTGTLALCRSTNEKEHPCDPSHGENFYSFEAEDFIGLQNYTVQSEMELHALLRQASIYRYKSVRPGRFEMFIYHSAAKTD